MIKKYVTEISWENHIVCIAGFLFKSAKPKKRKRLLHSFLKKYFVTKNLKKSLYIFWDLRLRKYDMKKTENEIALSECVVLIT